MYTFEIGLPFESCFSIYDNQVFLLVPDYYGKLTDKQYDKTSKILSSKGYEFIYLPKLVQSISGELLDYFIPEQADQLSLSYNTIQDNILCELELTLSSPIALMKVNGKLIGLKKKEDDADTVQFIQMLIEYLDERDSIMFRKCSIGSTFNTLDLDYCSYPDEDYARIKPSLSPNTIPFKLVDEEYTTDLLIEELKEIQEKKLRELGLSESALRFILGRTNPKISRLRITRHSKIVLDDYAGREIKLDTKTKALYFLYLRHPEGIAIKNLHDYYNELLDLYKSISGRDNPQAMIRTITNLIDPFQNNVNISFSRIKKAFCDAFTETLANKYYVEGERGGIRRIAIDRNLVTWETIRRR